MSNENTSKGRNALKHVSTCCAWPPPWLATASPAPPKAARQPEPIEPQAPRPTPPPVAQTDKPVCRCGSYTYRDTPIHEGRSTRRDCAECGRFLAFVVWYGRLLYPSEN